MDKSKIKKIVMAGVIALIVILAITVALGSMGGSRRNMGGYSSPEGFNMPSSTGLSSGPVEMMSLPAQDSAGSGNTFFSKEVSSDQAGNDVSRPVAIDKKIIKNGNLSLKVSNVDNASGDIAAIAKDNGGDVFSSNFYENTNIDKKSGTIIIKVPVANFDKALNEIKKVASLVVRESTSGQDVTEQYVDLQSRLKNKQEEEKAFSDILSHSGQIDDVLKVTRELSRVRGEIEVLQGQIKFMDSQTEMSMISVNLSEDDNITISDSWRPLQIAKDAVNNLISKVQKFISFVIVLIITVIPVLALYLLLFLMIYLIGKKIYHKVIKGREAKNVLPANNIKK